jgi:aspartyl-tRNA(Asn)/glutamyl-tRNA(Gln) amidotransferase subunit C
MPRATIETVDNVARLARLTLTDEEKTLFARQLDEILAWAESLQALDVANVPPMSHAHASDTWRDDQPGPAIDRERALAAAPDAAEGLFRVPRVIG